MTVCLCVQPVSAPIGPKTTRVNKVQRYRRLGKSVLVIENSCRMEDIPYGDHFTVEDRWIVRDVSDMSGCSIEFYMEVKFTKSTLWKGAIISRSETDCVNVSILEVMESPFR